MAELSSGTLPQPRASSATVPKSLHSGPCPKDNSGEGPHPQRWVGRQVGARQACHSREPGPDLLHGTRGPCSQWLVWEGPTGRQDCGGQGSPQPQQLPDTALLSIPRPPACGHVVQAHGAGGPSPSDPRSQASTPWLTCPWHLERGLGEAGVREPLLARVREPWAGSWPSPNSGRTGKAFRGTGSPVETSAQGTSSLPVPPCVDPRADPQLLGSVLGCG